MAMNPQTFTKKNWRFYHAAYFFGHGLFTQPDFEVHRKMRNMIGEAFSYTNLKLYFPIFILKSKITVSNLRASIGQGVNMYETFNDWAFDIIGKTAFGCDFDAQIPKKEKNKTQGQIIADKAREILNTPFGIGDYTSFRKLLPKNRKAYQVARSLNQQVEDIIQQKKERAEKSVNTNIEENENEKTAQKDLLDILIGLKHVDGSALAYDELVDQVKTFLLAGAEATASSITWTLWYLSQHPEIEKRLVNEIQTVLGQDSLPTVETLDKMKYLNNVFKESLRMMPPANQLTRTNETDIKLGGYLIPKGTTINTSTFALHHLPSLWENPEQFNPDRWEKDIDQDFGSFIPFGMGSRNCIGQRFALLEAKAILSMVLREFTFSIAPNHPKVRRDITIVMKPSPYLKLVPQLRK